MTEQNYRLFQKGGTIKFKTHQEFANDVLIGLSQPLKWLPSKYIYDTRGRKLFQEIMELPEYYLTRTEIEILKSNKTHRTCRLRTPEGIAFVIQVGLNICAPDKPRQQRRK